MKPIFLFVSLGFFFTYSWDTFAKAKSRPVRSHSYQDQSSSSAMKYFYPSWKNALERQPSNTFHYPVLDLSYFLADPENKINKEFRIPVKLHERILFWMNIYARYGSHTRVIHDADRLDIIYGIIDFSPLYRSEKSAIRLEMKMNKYEREVVRHLKNHLAELSKMNPVMTCHSGLKSHLFEFGVRNDKNVYSSLKNSVRSQSGQKEMFLLALYRSKDWTQKMESILKHHHLPIGLSRIPYVESSFNTKAYSKANAMGMWQFTRGTAKEFIHKKDKRQWVDPLRQTQGAARWFKRFNSIFPDWGLTVTSYNSGVTRVKRLTEKHKIKTVEDLILSSRIGNSLGFAGRNFYTEFIAASVIEAYQHEIFSPWLIHPVEYFPFAEWHPFRNRYCQNEIRSISLK